MLSNLKMTKIETLKNQLNKPINSELLIRILFDMTRYYDKYFTAQIDKLQKKNKVIYDSPTRKLLRKKFYYGSYYKIDNIPAIKEITYSKSDIDLVINDTNKRINKYSTEKIIKSIIKRQNDIENNSTTDDNYKFWLDNYKIRKEQTNCFSAIFQYFNNNSFAKNEDPFSCLYKCIVKAYKNLENYRHYAMVFNNEFYDKDNNCITWDLIFKSSIYAENFINFKDKYFAFKKDKQISSLYDFLKSRDIQDAKNIAENFYSCISTGFKFEDLYISDDNKIKILILKKIQLDETNIPCPSCNSTNQRGNSYPEMFLRSWECQNPDCPDRSKSGRGKRFDEFGAYRYYKLVEKNENNVIDIDFYKKWKRDIFNHNNDINEFLILEYTFNNESILVIDKKVEENYGRNIFYSAHDEKLFPLNYTYDFSHLPICQLIQNVLKNCHFSGKNRVPNNDIVIFNEDSINIAKTFSPGQIGAAITSPPYYNAREYSQWPSLLTYLVDMSINAKAINYAMDTNGAYLYNIGDIVGIDNVYVRSNMSKHRLQLGAYSALLFEIAGFNLAGNIIWDKGEVQSKRNSTINLFSGYIKCVNCYEHILIFSKNKTNKNLSKIKKQMPVFKINCKGINTYKHTAPYPPEIVDEIIPFTISGKPILDPYLGSGTTMLWCKKNNYKGIGYEINENYYKLTISRLRSSGL